jgi:signal transduction histidine kinase
MKFDRKILLGVVVIVISFLPMIFTAFLSLRKVVEEQNLLAAEKTQSLLLSERLRSIDSMQSSLIPVFVLTGEKKMLEVFERQHQEFQEVGEKLANTETDPELLKLIAAIKETSTQLHAKAQPGIKLREKSNSVEETNDYFTKHAGPLEGRLQNQLDELVHKEFERREEAIAHVRVVIGRVTDILLVMSIFALALVIFIARLIIRVLKQKKAFDEAQLVVMHQERQLSLARKETVEVVAHDLKSPLATIRMSTEILQEEMAKATLSAEFRQGLEIIRRSVESMERLIRDLLDHAKIEAGHLVLEKSDCDITGFVKSVVQRFVPLAKKKKIDLIYEGMLSSAVVNCDIGRIEQVLANLLSNSLKFTKEGGKVRVALRTTGDRLVISVADNGPGLAKEQIPHIFDRFWQVRETAKQGTGLGLAIAKAIVDSHQGQIWVESEVGNGATFFVSLPRKIPTIATVDL